MTRGEDASAQLNTDSVVASASGKKLVLLAASPGSMLDTPPTSGQFLDLSSAQSVGFGGEMKGYRFINTETQDQTLRKARKCVTCSSTLTLNEDTSVRRGLVSRLTVQCENPACYMMSYLSNPYSEEARVLNTLF